MAFENKDDAKAILNALKADKHIVAACLYDKEGHIFSKYPDNLSSQDFPTLSKEDVYQFNNSQLQAIQAGSEGDTRLGTLYLSSDMDAMYARLRLYAIIVCIIILLSYLLAYLLSIRLREILLKPIFSMVETSHSISINNDYLSKSLITIV